MYADELVFAFLMWALYSHRLVAERTDEGEYVLFLFHVVMSESYGFMCVPYKQGISGC